MRIVLFNPAYPPMPCGIGAYTQCLAGELAAAGHEVTVVTTTAAAGASTPGVTILAALPDWGVRDYLSVLRRLPRPDLVISNYPSVLPGAKARLLFLLPGLAKLTLGRPRVTFVVHEFARTEERARRLLALALRAADDVVAVTEEERRALAQQHPFAAERLRVVEIATNVLPAEPDADEEARVRKRTGLPPAGGAPLVLFTARLTSADKGFEELLDAVAGTDAALAATGTLDPADPLHADVAARIERLGIADRVHWLGDLSSEDLARLIQAADVVAVPYRTGAVSSYGSMLGALVNGAPVVTTRGPDSPAWLVDGETAVIVEPHDAASLQAGLRRVLDDPGLAATLRDNALALTPLFGGWGRVADELMSTTDTGRTPLIPPKDQRCNQPLPVAIARIGAGLVRRRVLRRPRAKLDLGGRGVFVDADLDTAIGLHLYRHGWCDEAADAIDLLVQPGGTVVDGGANVGLFTLTAAAVVGPGGHVHAVEAAPKTAELLRRSVALNPDHDIVVHEVALAEQPGELEFTTFEAGSGSSSLAPAGEGTVERVRATTLDELTAGMERVDLVKLDLEGSELRALQGASRLLAEQRPALIVELEPGHLQRQGGTVAELEDLLTEAGYEAFTIDRPRRGAVTLQPLARPWQRPAGEPNIVLRHPGRG